MTAPVTLDTPRLHLRELVDADHVATNVWESDPEVVRFMSTDAGTLADSLEYIRSVRLESDAEPRLLYDLGVERRTDGLLMGRIGLRVTRPAHREGEVWFVFRADCHGQGYAFEAVRALVDFGFGTLALHRIAGDCDPRNTRSARLMEKLGMRREAHLRENEFIKGEWCDELVYAMLAREWRARATGDGA
jgi:RimJ/RimL family protein N-acetyltransferase